MKTLEMVHRMVWGPWTLVIFLGVGILFTVKCGFFQIRKFPFWWKATAGTLFRDKRQFRTVCTALAATVGTGNIAGVATALVAGGPGALFWMWVSAFLGMMTAYAETSLGIRFRGRLCGPFSYMERGLGLKPMASAYSFLCLLCALGMGSMVQANSAVETLHYTWKLPVFFCGLVFTGLLALVVCGGSRRIGAVAQALIPLASGLYLLFSLLVIISNYEQLPRAVAAIFSSAFCLRPAAGGIAGYGMIKSMRYGIARGVFSNEAGLGTLAILHGSAGETTPEEQGMWAMFEVFFDTVVLCTLTALVILSSVGGEAGRILLNGAPLAAWCFEKCLGRAGGWVVSASMTLFAFATIIAWFYVGKQAASYLVGENHFFAGKIYPFLFLGAVFLGCSGRLEAVWLFSDIVNGLMAFPNLTALLFLANEVRVPKTKENVSPSDDTFL